MKEEALDRHLHDLATRGEALTPEEQAHLEAWYAQQDQEEEALLASPLASKSSTSLARLRSEVDAALQQLRTVTERIQSLAEENEALRDEITALGHRLTHAASAEAA